MAVVVGSVAVKRQPNPWWCCFPKTPFSPFAVVVVAPAKRKDDDDEDEKEDDTRTTWPNPWWALLPRRVTRNWLHDDGR